MAEPQTSPSSSSKTLTGGCLCGALRYTLSGLPLHAGLCYCTDCQRIGGSAFLPFMVYKASRIALTIKGAPYPHDQCYPPRTDPEAPAQWASTAYKDAVKQIKAVTARGGDKEMNRCATCGSTVFSFVWGKAESHGVYAGTLDQNCQDGFRPTIAVFTRDRPAWAKLAMDLKEFEGLPPGA
jgi:hypothetical protein